jgi:hypothetical protein
LWDFKDEVAKELVGLPEGRNKNLICRLILKLYVIFTFWALCPNLRLPFHSLKA